MHYSTVSKYTHKEPLTGIWQANTENFQSVVLAMRLLSKHVNYHNYHKFTLISRPIMIIIIITSL
jgi:hypothetical protein